MYRSVFHREITFISRKMQYPEQSKTEKLIKSFNWTHRPRAQGGVDGESDLSKWHCISFQ